MPRENEAYPDATCAYKGCGQPWVKWCRKCNLVYCVMHAPYDLLGHSCKGIPKFSGGPEKVEGVI